MPRMRDLHVKLHNEVDFLLVYTLEAHADNEWPINSAWCTHDGEPVHVNQPKSLRERKMLARSFAANYKVAFPILIDDMSNSFEAAFASWPTRYYIVQKSKLVYKAQPEGGDGAEFTLDSLEAALEECLKK